MPDQLSAESAAPQCGGGAFAGAAGGGHGPDHIIGRTGLQLGGVVVQSEHLPQGQLPGDQQPDESVDPRRIGERQCEPPSTLRFPEPSRSHDVVRGAGAGDRALPVAFAGRHRWTSRLIQRLDVCRVEHSPRRQDEGIQMGLHALDDLDEGQCGRCRSGAGGGLSREVRRRPADWRGRQRHRLTGVDQHRTMRCAAVSPR